MQCRTERGRLANTKSYAGKAEMRELERRYPRNTEKPKRGETRNFDLGYNH